MKPLVVITINEPLLPLCLLAFLPSYSDPLFPPSPFRCFLLVFMSSSPLEGSSHKAPRVSSPSSSLDDRKEREGLPLLLERTLCEGRVLPLCGFRRGPGTEQVRGYPLEVNQCSSPSFWDRRGKASSPCTFWNTVLYTRCPARESHLHGGQRHSTPSVRIPVKVTSTAGLTGAGLAPGMATTLGVTCGSDKTGEDWIQVLYSELLQNLNSLKFTFTAVLCWDVEIRFLFWGKAGLKCKPLPPDTNTYERACGVRFFPSPNPRHCSPATEQFGVSEYNKRVPQGTMDRTCL